MDLRKTPLAGIPVPSTEFASEPVLRLCGSRLLLEMDHGEEHAPQRCTLVFDGPQAHALRSEGACKAWHVEDTFDTVCEVVNSPWLEEVRTIADERGYAPRELHHFMIYLDSFGCCEAIATGWSIETEGVR